MIVRKFTCTYHDDMGQLGWKPTFLKGEGIEPAWDFTLAHDILEHAVDNIGGAEGEFMALGAMMWGRGGSGWFFSKGGSVKLSEILASDFEDILITIASGKETLRCPGRTYKLSDYDDLEKEMSKGIRDAIKAFKKNKYNDIKEIPCPEGDIERRIVGWMRKGFRKARDYYGKYGLDSHGVSYIFDQIADIARKHNPERYMEGEVLTIRIDPTNCDVTASLHYDW